MEDFSIRREKRRLSVSKRVAVFALAAFLGISPAAGIGSTSETQPLPGMVMPVTISHEEAAKIVDRRFGEILHLEMTHDVPLTIRQGWSAIDFTADGYNAGANIAYEFADGDYSAGQPREIITERESRRIEDFHYGDTYILSIRSYYLTEYLLNSVIDEFIKVYTNR